MATYEGEGGERRGGQRRHPFFQQPSRSLSSSLSQQTHRVATVLDGLNLLRLEGGHGHALAPVVELAAGLREGEGGGERAGEVRAARTRMPFPLPPERAGPRANVRKTVVAHFQNVLDAAADCADKDVVVGDHVLGAL
jgi:hypothetical protein